MDATSALGVGESTSRRGEDMKTNGSGTSDRGAHREGGNDVEETGV
jgi:hypothetical protein